MELIDEMGVSMANLEAVRQVLKVYPGSHAVHLTNWQGSATLEWKENRETLHRSVHTSIPLFWMNDPQRRGHVEAATRNVAAGVLAELRRSREQMNVEPRTDSSRIRVGTRTGVESEIC